MSYQQSKNIQGGQGQSIRQSVDSRDSYRSSFRPSIEGRDSCSTFGTQLQIDKICFKINEVDKTNQQIRQQLMNLSKNMKSIKTDNDKYKQELKEKIKISIKQKQQRVTKAEKRVQRHTAIRQGINDMIHDQLKLVDQINVSLKGLQNETDKMKYENQLDKKAKGVEQLSKILLDREKEFIVISKHQNIIQKKMGITGQKDKGKYELQSLLDESSSDEDKNRDDDKDSDDSWEDGSTQQNTQQNFDNDDDLLIDLGEENDGEQMQTMMEEEKKISSDDPEVAHFQQRMDQRTEQIGNVTSSIGRIQSMFQSLNEIVNQQGQSLDRLENNIIDSKQNTKETVDELKEAVKNEKPNIQERVSQPIGSDLSTTCVLIWFFFALIMFLIDFKGQQDSQAEDQIIMDSAQNKKLN